MEDSDRNGDDRVDTRTTCEYGAGGELVLKEVDGGIDGTVDERYVWDYVDGHLREHTADRDGDGIVNSRIHFETDEAGFVTVEEHDDNADGSIERRVVLEYDELGNRIGSTVDFGVDGVIDRSCYYRPPCPPPYTLDVCSESLYCEPVPPPLPAIAEQPASHVYAATVDQLVNEQSEIRSADHTLVMFSIDEVAAGWLCPACEHMRVDFTAWALLSDFRGLRPTELRFVLVEIDPDDLEPRPAFLLDDIVGFPTIVHLVSGRQTEKLEDRIRGFVGVQMRALRLMVESIEAAYQ